MLGILARFDPKVSETAALLGVRQRCQGRWLFLGRHLLGMAGPGISIRFAPNAHLKRRDLGQNSMLERPQHPSFSAILRLVGSEGRITFPAILCSNLWGRPFFSSFVVLTRFLQQTNA